MLSLQLKCLAFIMQKIQSDWDLRQSLTSVLLTWNTRYVFSLPIILFNYTRLFFKFQVTHYLDSSRYGLCVLFIFGVIYPL